MKKTTKRNSKKTETRPKSQTKNNEDSLKRYKVKYELKIVVLIAITLFMILSLYTEAVGILGGSIKGLLLGVFSYVGYLIPFILFFYAFVYLNPNFKPARVRFYTGFTMILISLIIMNGLLQSDNLELNSKSIVTIYNQSSKLESGGVIGEVLSKVLIDVIGKSGTIIFAISMIIIGFIVVTRISLQDLWDVKRKQINQKIANKKTEKDAYESYVLLNKRESKVESKTSYVVEGDNFLSNLEMRRREKNKKNIKSFDYDSYEQIPVEKSTHELRPVELETNNFDAEDEVLILESLKPDLGLQSIKTIEFSSHDDVIMKKEKAIEKVKNNTIDEKTAKIVVDEINQSVQNTVENYIMPPIELLKDMPVNPSVEDKSEYLEMAKCLEETLNNFGVEAKVLSVKKGPAITMFEIQPSPGIKVSKIVGLSDDIALNLATSHVRIAPIPGKAAIGIEVPNKSTSMVTLREVIGMEEFKSHNSKLAIGLGKDISGNPIIGDLSSMPHLLIAGATGSGKSVCVNTIVSSILYNAKPDEVKFLMIDPKVVELSNYNGIPHLILPVVTDPKKASIALNWAVNEMTRRYKLFADTGVRDMKSFNKKAEIGGMEKLAQIVVIIDELADLMMVAPNQVEDAICRLAQMARAAGIHLIVATQRPSVDVITGLIKANIPSRIAFSVSSSIDSRTIIDMGGAEKLLGKGDMLYYPVGAAKPKRAQGAFMSDEEVEALVHFIKNQAVEVKYNEDILEEVQPISMNDEDQIDEHLEDAIAFVVETGQASASLLQRRFRVGYNRAARLIDSMEERAIIGPARGSKPREVLMSSHDLKALVSTQLDMFDEEDDSIIEE